MQLTSNVYIETGVRGCNRGYITTKEGIVVVDTPISLSDAVKWRKEIESKGEVRYVIITDAHRDHFQGSALFPGILIAHEEVRRAMSGMTVEQVKETIKRSDPEALPLLQDYTIRLPAITFTEDLNLYLGDHLFELIHLPGHTAGVIGVHIPQEHVVFASDCIFYKRRSIMHEAVPQHWLESLRRLKDLEVDTIIPGHGNDICTKEYIKEQENIILRWMEAIKTGIEQGLTMSEMQDKISCPDPHPLGPLGMPISESELHRATVADLYQVLGQQQN